VNDESLDLVISNCVVNLSPDKPAILRSVYNGLKNGGEFYFSDVYASRRIPERLQKDKTLWGECLSGALYEHDFISMVKKIGFADPRELSRSEITVGNPKVKEQLGKIKFWSITYRLFKLPGMLEDRCEDYGQVAFYLG
jgi:arsenite methyltransferase